MGSRLSSAEVVARMPIACITFSPEWKIESWNPAASRIFGWSEEEIIGRDAAVLLPQEMTPELTRITEQILGGAKVEKQVNENVTKDGRTIICRWSNTPIVSNGEIIGVLSMAEDITDELQTQSALRRSELRHRDLVNSLPHYIFSVDNENRYTAVNAAVCGFFGRPESEIIGRTAVELGIASHVAEPWCETNRRTREAGMTMRNVDTLASGDRIRYMDAVTTPIREDDGRIVGITGISIDVTEQKNAEDERRRFEERISELAKMEALGTLAGGIAHDFNNILSIILTYTTLLGRRAGDDEASRKAVETLRQAIDRGAALSRQILTFARRTDIQAARVDATKVIVELASMVRETFPRNIQLAIDSDLDLPSVEADPAQLHQALLNLCINARDAMPDGGVLSLEARRIGGAAAKQLSIDASACDHVCISVRDSGSGMSEQTRRRIFEPFFTTKDKGKGTGLGLAMVYGVVKAHGGFIDVESSLAGGTTFRLCFPVGAAEAVSATRRSEIAPV